MLGQESLGLFNSIFPLDFVIATAKLQDLYSKGHPYPGYPGYVMMSNMNDSSYMNNGSLSPPMARTVSDIFLYSIEPSRVRFCQLQQLKKKNTISANVVV